MSRTISFRGVLADGGIEEIKLQTNNGLTGYRIVKLEIMGTQPGAANYEAVVQVFKTKEAATPASAIVDFSNNRLLGAATYQGNSAAFNYPTTQFTIFDLEVFNQNIFITNQCLQNGVINYHIELEQMPLDLNTQTVATLKDIRNVGAE